MTICYKQTNSRRLPKGRFGMLSIGSIVFIIVVTGMQMPFVVTAQELTTPDTKTLEEVKAEGALRSIYRKLVPQANDYETPQANLEAFRSAIEPALRKACYKCHGPDTAEGDFRVDKLDPDLFHGDDVSWWLEVSSAVGNGEMPPKDGPELADEDRKRIIEWLASEMQGASQVRRAEQGHSSFRRMTRYEYNYALQDLLGLELDFAKDLPPDPISPDGFKNSSDMLQMTGKQYAEYLELNRNALERATVSGKRPDVLCWGVSAQLASASKFADLETTNARSAKQTRATPARAAQRNRQQGGRRDRGGGRGNPAHYKNTETGQTVPATWSYVGAVNAWAPTLTRPETPEQSEFIAVLPARQRIVVELGNRLPDKGTLRVRVRASQGSVDPRRVPTLALEFGWQGDKDQRAAFRISSRDLIINAPLGEPTFYQWDISLSEIHPRSADIQFDYVEVSAPVYDVWPPKSHLAIFIDSENRDDEDAYAREIVARFMRRAWRRNVTEAEVDLQMKLFARVRPVCVDFEQAVVETLAAVLSSPRFLYLVQTDRSRPYAQALRPLDPFELATRLAMFLWCSTPDDQLLDLAAKERLNQPDELVRQTRRMLADPRHKRFSKHFVRQWLNMAPLEFVTIDRRTYPQFNDVLKEAMEQEPIECFEEMLRNNHSVIDFLHADYAMVNERLAQHYGISDVVGNEFRKVSLKPEDKRGGLLTQAGLLAMNSDGKDSHPLKRGIWLLESILNDPPPPPPPAVPEIDLADPEIAKMTPKQQMADHRNKAACMTCHTKIDPWGIAFENFDAVGNWRTQSDEKEIDASSLLYDQHELKGVGGVKRYLLANRQDQFARAIVHKMTTFALGRPLTFSDRSSIDRLTAELRKEGDGLATLVTLIVTSDMFQSR